MIFGWKKKDGEDVSEIQALRYKKDTWTESSARAHCQSRGGTFEPASTEDKMKMKWYEIVAKSDVSEVWIYDEIGFWGVTAKEFIVELNALKSKKIDMHINSPGGDVFDGAAIYNAVKRHPAEVTAYIDGIAASIASVIALAGKKVHMAKNAIYMMHNPSGLVMGTAEDMRKTADILEKVRDTMVLAYTDKSRKTAEDIKALLDAETWYNAEEAMEAGFVDSLGEEIDLAACSKFLPAMSKMGYKHVPTAQLGAYKTIPSERDLERILRDAGCSAKQAKAILARGYSKDLRDGDPAEPVPPAPNRRDADPKPGREKDRVNDLLVRAEKMAPSRT